MAFPKLLTKLFQNDGASSMLRTDIIPVDSALSATSANAVQNKIVKAALDSVSTKADTTGYQVGDIKLYAGSDVPDGWFRCDGSTIADMATNYPKLYAVLGTNVLPNYSGRVPLGSTTAINSTVEAGLPNATGFLNQFYAYDPSVSPASATGAFVLKVNNVRWLPSGLAENGSLASLSLDLSKGNAIYGASESVQPPAVKVAVLIKHD